MTNFSFSQEKISFVDYKEILEKIEKETDSEKIVNLINTTNKNDSAYYSLLSTKSYYLLQLKKYEETIKVANEGMYQHHEHTKDIFFINKGVALSSLNRYDEALKNYNKGLKLYPKNHMLWYNKGYVLEIQGKLNEAIKAYKTTISLNPTYTKPHLRIGNIFYKQERITQALMCFNMYLLLDPDAAEAFTILKSLNNIVNAKNINKRDRNLRLDDADDSFEELDLILNSKLAMNKNYKTGNPINISLTRQNHAMIQQLKDFEGKDSFWKKTYIPFYKWIAKNNKFDDFIYTLTYSIENETYKKIIQKKTDEIILFLGELKTEWAKLVSKNNILFNGEQQEVTFEYADGQVNAIGKIQGDNPSGLWEFYNDSGRLTATGNFDNSGNKMGKWTWYNQFNKVKETAFYVNGLLEGQNLIYHNNGKKYVNANFKSDSLSGLYESFNNKGALEQRKYFKSSNLEGAYKSYFEVGEKLPEFYITYKNGEIDGEILEYYANGDLYAKSYYVSGKKNGLETVYHYNKKVSSEIAYENGVFNGSYKTYHANGQPNEIGQTIEGSYEGPWRMYYDDGTLKTTFTYKKGKLHDLYQYYDTDGKLFYDFVYRKGEIIAYKFYNKEGNVIKEDKKKGGEFYYVGFSPKGNKTSEGLYDISGGKIGDWNFYSDIGVLTEKGTFIEGKATNNYTNFYKNGDVEYIRPYKDGTLEGYYVAYHPNKQMSVQGWYKNDNQHGEWRYYYLDGTLKATNFYHKGKRHGAQNNYGVDGKLILTANYNFDHLIDEKYYGKDEKLFETVSYSAKEKEYNLEFKHFNQKTKIKTSYVNEVKHGNYEVLYFNGNKKITGNYLNDQANGLWTWYYENGNIESKAYYSSGKVHGKVINYYKNGKIQGDYTFENDLEIGTSIRYYNTGIVSSKNEYYNGKRHGKKSVYDELGKLQLIRFYNHGELIGYSYLDKNGTEIAMIPLERETGKIEAFFDNGKPSVIMEYKFREVINTFKSYSYNGEIENESPYLNGNYHGVIKEYFLSGKLKEETNYNHGEKHGKNIIYYENGNKKEELLFSNDLKHGMSYFYNKKGKLKMKKEYFNGKLYKVESL